MACVNTALFPGLHPLGPLAAQIKFVAPHDLVSGLLCLAVTVKGVSETQEAAGGNGDARKVSLVEITVSMLSSISC